MTPDSLREAIKQEVDKWPPLSELQRASLPILLKPGSSVDAVEAAKRDVRAAQEKTIALKEKAEQEAIALAAQKAAMNRCALYRHYDRDGVLLYVGITVLSNRRRREHQKDAPWFRFQHREEVEWLSNRTAAEKAETDAILAEQPIFNQRGAADGATERRVQYLARHEAWDLLRTV